MPEFDKWWNDTKKHRKRTDHWLPHAKGLAARIGSARGIRYFTLCARSMIDVFMFVKEGLLKLDAENYSIGSIQFCECEQDQFAETRDLIAKEDAGFFGRLEDIVLFEDDDFTAQYPTSESIAAKLEDERLQADYAAIDKLQLKRTHFSVRDSFPYDFVNLDFCQYYYQRPPGMLRINRTVEKFLDWQRRASEDEEKILLPEFVLTVTCRHDANFPQQAETRLVEIIRANCIASQEYKDVIERTRSVTEIEEWARNNREDFFFAGWPKDIARAAKECGWAMDILDYVYYRRVGDEQNPYIIVCLVARFSRVNLQPDYIPSALYALREENRKLIPEIDRASSSGQQLLANLAEIVVARNEQARRKQRPELPDP
jgi:hypothetical protein